MRVGCRIEEVAGDVYAAFGGGFGEWLQGKGYWPKNWREDPHTAKGTWNAEWESTRQPLKKVKPKPKVRSV